MNNLYLIVGLFVVLLIVCLILNSGEKFDMGMRSSTAFGWTVGTDYVQGGGINGYSMIGIWPSNIPSSPWKPWMWSARTPSIFKKEYTPIPQVDYLTAPDDSKPISNLQFDLRGGSNGTAVLTVNGELQPNLELLRNTPYYFHIHTPGAKFVLTQDGTNPFFEPVESGNYNLLFTDQIPDRLYYMIQDHPETGGTINLRLPHGPRNALYTSTL